MAGAKCVFFFVVINGVLPAVGTRVSKLQDALEGLNDSHDAGPGVVEGVGQAPHPKTLIMSDVDDTLTCPRQESRAARVAGSDNCLDMHHGEIYYGIGLFLYLVGFQNTDNADFIIVSANPLSSGYPHIENYVATVSSHCKAYVQLNPHHIQTTTLPGDITVDGVKKGRMWASIGAVQSMFSGNTDKMVLMGAWKLKQMMVKAHLTKPSKIVWLGDSGQGDVCSGLCLLYPDDCPDRMKIYIAGSKTLSKDNITLGGDFLKDVEKYAFFHLSKTPLKEEGAGGWSWKSNSADDPSGILSICFQKALTKPNIYFFGFPEREESSGDYTELMDGLCTPDRELDSHQEVQYSNKVIDCKLYKDLQNRAGGHGDCIPPGDYDRNLYMKHKVKV